VANRPSTTSKGRRPSRPVPVAPKPPATPVFSSEQMFVQVTGNGEAPQFFSVSERLGKPMPFTRMTATVAMRVYPTVVAVSLLMVSNKARQSLVEAPVEMPVSPLERLERKARGYRSLGLGELVVDFNGRLHRMRLLRDGGGVVTVEHVDTDEDVLFEIPRGGPRLTLFLRSPMTDRVLAVSAMGARYPGKPGATDSLLRAVSMTLFQLSQLLEFRTLSSIETVDVPPPPGRDAAPSGIDLRAREVAGDVPVWLFVGQPPMPVASGKVRVNIDLAHANPATGHLIVHLVPCAPLTEDEFAPFKHSMQTAVRGLLEQHLGTAELSDLAIDVVLGGLSESALERLSEAVTSIATGLDLSSDRFRVHGQ
jgi:hypothetical protein